MPAQFDLWVRQLEHHVVELEANYKYIYLVGHSLGGKLAEAVAREIVTKIAHTGESTSLAALVLIASPRAGTSWAMPILTPIVREFAALRSFSPLDDSVERYFREYVDRKNVGQSPGRKILPTYAVIGIDDKIVQAFSASFQVPDSQKHYLSAGHKDIVKPFPDDDELVQFIQQKVVAERRAVLEQAERERAHARHRRPGAPTSPRDVIVTRFLTDPSGLFWEEIYNEVRAGSTTPNLLLQDHREIPDARLDAVIAVHDADLVTAMQPAVRANVAEARRECESDSTLTVSLHPVGATASEAKDALLTHISGHDLPGRWFVSDAPDEAGLRANLARLLENLRNRDPRRFRSVAPGPRRPYDALHAIEVHEEERR